MTASASSRPPRFAVIGHLEWTEFVNIERLPRAGEIVNAHASWSEPAGGGAVAAVALAGLTGGCHFFTALGRDDAGRSARERLTKLGVTVHAAVRNRPTRRAFVQLERSGERTITTIGDRLEPFGGDPLPWELLDGLSGAYVTAGDAGAVEAARAAALLVATPRTGDALAGVPCDALVFSARDAGESERAARLTPLAHLAVATEGALGGSWQLRDGRRGRYAAAESPAGGGDSYGAGDCFAAGLTFALGSGDELAQALVAAASAGAQCAARRGPYGGLEDAS